MAVACAGMMFANASQWRAHKRNAPAPSYAARILVIGAFAVLFVNLVLYFFVWDH
jgi:hypothetical protein